MPFPENASVTIGARYKVRRTEPSTTTGDAALPQEWIGTVVAADSDDNFVRLFINERISWVGPSEEFQALWERETLKENFTRTNEP